MYYLGVDGGGTGSRLMACDEAGSLYGPWHGGPTNLNSNPEAAVRDALAALLDAFSLQTGAGLADVAGLCIGTAGVDRPGDEAPWLALLRALGLGCPVFVVNDIELVLEGETGGAPGMVLLSGTGSVAYGRHGARSHRCGGWGHRAGDEGSGYWIGREALRRALRAVDGRDSPTALGGLLAGHFGVSDVRDTLRAVYGPTANKADLAALAPLVDRAAEAGDAVALEILRNAAAELTKLAATVARALDLAHNFPIIVCGGTLKGSVLLMELLRPALIALDAQPRPVSREPCLGAVLLARRLAESAC